VRRTRINDLSQYWDVVNQKHAEGWPKTREDEWQGESETSMEEDEKSRRATCLGAIPFKEHLAS